MRDVRCENCNGLLGKFSLSVGEVKCHRCNHLNKLAVLSQKGIDLLYRKRMIKA